MNKNKWIGTALSLALCSVALSGCNYSSGNSSQSANGPSSAPEIDSAWKSDTEKQLRDAIASAPANGLKPDLFLKGGEKGAQLTQAALKYASALANGYADPAKLHEVYTIPHQTVDVRAGLKEAIQKGDIKAWLDSLPPQTDEYRALSQAHLHFLQLAANTQFQPVPEGKPIKPGPASSASDSGAERARVLELGADPTGRPSQAVTTRRKNRKRRERLFAATRGGSEEAPERLWVQAGWHHRR